VRRRHHLGAVIWAPSPGADDTRRLDQAASAVATPLGAGEPLVVVRSRGSELWAWYSAIEAFRPDALAALAGLTADPGVRIAVGRPRPDLDGFRRSHDDARAAARVAVLAGDGEASLTLYDDVELASLLSADLVRARAFVRDELGQLAGPSRMMARLRDTMLVLLEEGMSNAHTAERLFVHQNTVAYRLGRAQELLGHRLVDRRFQSTAALVLAQTLGPAVLDVE
jgi:DNA-binding PucR family transcriptional regulator